jgi:hypothetical protein
MGLQINATRVASKPEIDERMTIKEIAFISPIFSRRGPDHSPSPPRRLET